MDQCFKPLPVDTKDLHLNTKALRHCDTRATLKTGAAKKVVDVPVLTCDCMWRLLQREAEAVVAPGGQLIADPQARNRNINAMYARLWLEDPRFEWAGLAAFASKQVGCGLAHASQSMQAIDQAERARMDAAKSSRSVFKIPSVIDIQQIDPKAAATHAQAQAHSPARVGDIRTRDSSTGQENSFVRSEIEYVHQMLALGNTTLFLDVFPLHAFYKKRGLTALRECLGAREKIVGNPDFPVLWLVGSRLRFGRIFAEILPAFEAIDRGDVETSVQLLAQHEQRNILQPVMYDDSHMRLLLRGNQLSFVTGLPNGVAQAVELTLADQCQAMNDGRSVSFSRKPQADLGDFDQRFEFVMRAARRFHDLLNGPQRATVVHSLQQIAAGRGVQ